MKDINGVTTRTVDGEVLDALVRYLDRPDVRGRIEDRKWAAVTLKAVSYLRHNPIAVDAQGEGHGYMVEVPSKSQHGEVWHADKYTCHCTGNVTSGHCYHRAIALLLPMIDKIEASRAAQWAEKARREARPIDNGEGDTEWYIAYDGTFLGYAATEDEAQRRLQEYALDQIKRRRLEATHG
jgi:hypothetical protein